MAITSETHRHRRHARDKCTFVHFMCTHVYSIRECALSLHVRDKGSTSSLAPAASPIDTWPYFTWRRPPGSRRLGLSLDHQNRVVSFDPRHDELRCLALTALTAADALPSASASPRLSTTDHSVWMFHLACLCVRKSTVEKALLPVVTLRIDPRDSLSPTPSC